MDDVWTVQPASSGQKSGSHSPTSTPTRLLNHAPEGEATVSSRRMELLHVVRDAAAFACSR